MPSFFDEIETASQEAVSSIFAQRIRIRPQAGDQNYGGGPDPSRVPIELDATLSTAPKVINPDFQGTARNGTDTALAPSEIWIDRLNASAITYSVRRGDKIEILSETTVVSTFIVAASEPGDHGDLRLVLTR